MSAGNCIEHSPRHQPPPIGEVDPTLPLLPVSYSDVPPRAAQIPPPQILLPIHRDIDVFHFDGELCLGEVYPEFRPPKSGHFFDEFTEAFRIDLGGHGDVRPHGLDPSPIGRDQPSLFTDEWQPFFIAVVSLVRDGEDPIVALKVIVHVQAMRRYAKNCMREDRGRIAKRLQGAPEF